jgi:DNA-binding transcriptional ArsR family regulator
MPTGMVVVGWNDRVGTVLKGKYPDTVDLSPDLTMKIYGSHVLGEQREAGFISMKVGELNIASYFGGIEINHFVSVVLKDDEDAPAFESALTRVAGEIFGKLEKDQFIKDLPALYRHLATFPTFNEEQRLAYIFADAKTRAALQYLSEVGSASKEELADIIRDRLDLKTVSIEPILQPLVRAGLVMTEWVEGIPSECVFLVQDSVPVLTPPANLLKLADAGSIPESKRFVKAVNSFFKAEPAILPEDRLATVAELLVDPDAYEILKLLRNGVLNEAALAAQTKLAADVTANTLKRLVSAHIVIEEKETGVYLVADPQMITTFPEYLIGTAISRYNKKEVMPRQAARYLSLLRDQYKHQLVTTKASS